MGNKLCKDCFKSKPLPQSPKSSPKTTEMKEFGSKQEIQKLNPAHKRDPSLPSSIIDNSQCIPEYNIQDLQKMLERIPLSLDSPKLINMTRSIKKKAPLRVEPVKDIKGLGSAKSSLKVGSSSKMPFHMRIPSDLPIPEERESNEEIKLPKEPKKIARKKEKSKIKKSLLKTDTFKGSPAETSSAIKDLRMYSFSPSLDSDILIYANNFILDTVESLWALNHNTMYQHINIGDYDVLCLLPDRSFKIQNKVTMQYYRLSVIEFPPENPLNLASLYSQGAILDKLQTLKYFNKFSGKIESMYTIESSESFPKPLYSFKAVKLQEFGVCSLEDLLDRGFKFTPNQVLYFLKTISGLCQKSEALGIANRKLIPSNFLLSENFTDFRIHDYSLACDLGSEKVTNLQNWIRNIEDFWAPEITDILGSQYKKAYDPFKADVFTLGLSCLIMMRVRRDELSLLKANEMALDKKLNLLDEAGYGEVVKLLRGMLSVKPDIRLDFKDIHESLKAIVKGKGSTIINRAYAQKIKQEELVKDEIFFENLGDLVYLITGEAESVPIYEEAMTLTQMQGIVLEDKVNEETQIRLYEKMAKAQYALEQFGKAARSYLSLIELNKKRLNSEKDLEAIKSLIIMAHLRSEQMNYTTGSKLFVEAYEKCLTFYNDRTDRLEFAFIYKGFGEMLVKIHTFQELGLQYLYKAIEVVQKTEGIKSQVYFIFLDALAEAFEKVKAIYNASQIYHRIVDEGRVVYGKVHPLLSKMYLKLSYAYYDQESYLKAQTFYKKGLALQLRIFGEKSIEVAMTKLQLAKAYLNTQEWKKALKLLNESLEGTRKIMGEGTREVALVLNAMGLAYSIKPNYNKSLEFYNKAYETLKEIPDKDLSVYLDMGRFLEDIGGLYALQRNKTKALSYYYQGLLMKKEAYGEYSSDVGIVYERIGDVNLDFDDGTAALEAYRNALEIYMKNETHDFLGCIRLLEHVGKLTILQGDSENDSKKEAEYLKKGMDYLLKCVDMQEKYLSDKSEEEVEWKRSICNYIAGIFFEKQEYEESLKYMLIALTLLQKLYKNPTEEVSDLMHNIGTVYYKQNEQNLALDYTQKGYEIRLNLFGKNDSSVAQSLSMMVKIYKGMKDHENAAKIEGNLNEMLKIVNVNDEDMKTGLLKLDHKRTISNKI